MSRTLTPRRILAAIALAVTAMVIAPTPASAHAGIESSSPAAARATSAAVRGPIVWELGGNRRVGTATGVLPTAGVWTFEATLEMPNDAIVVVTGSVTLKG